MMAIMVVQPAVMGPLITVSCVTRRMIVTVMRHALDVTDRIT